MTDIIDRLRGHGGKMSDTDKASDAVPDEGRTYRWEIYPHPYNSSFDIFVTDDDQEALRAIVYAAELHLWDSAEPGQERVLRVRLNDE